LAAQYRSAGSGRTGFIGIRPGIVALDLSAAGGYTTAQIVRPVRCRAIGA
jgi:hypothetical protein